MIRTINRRQFLQGIGGYSLAIPFLPSLCTPSEARAASLAPPKRFVAILQGHCYFGREFWPSSSASTTIANSLMSVKSRDLSSVSGVLSPILSDPNLLSLKNKITLIKGLQSVVACGDNSHPTDRMLRGSAIDPGNESMDVVLSNWSQFYSQAPIQKILSYTSNTLYSPAMSFKISANKDIPLPMDSDPVVVFNRVFNHSTSSGGSSLTMGDRRKFVVDRTLASFNAIRNGSKISKAEKALFESFYETIFEIQKSISATPAISCNEPSTPTSTYNIKQREHMAMKIITAALACDTSRIATIHFMNGDSGDGPDSVQDGSWHDNGHPEEALNELGPNATQTTRRINQTNFGIYVASMIGEMMKQLDAVIEDTANGTTALDNSIIYWSNGMGDVDDYGGSLATHGDISLKTFLAGGGNLGIKTGQYLQYSKVFNQPYPYDGTFSYLGQCGPPQNQLLVSLLQAFGMTPQDYEKNGKQGFGNYGKYFGDTVGENLFDNSGYMNLMSPLISDRRSPLPALFK